MHPWSKFSKEEYEKRQFALKGTMGIVVVIMIALFYVQVRVIFNTPAQEVDNDPIELGLQFFNNVSEGFDDVSDDVSEVFEKIGGTLEDESKRFQGEQAVYSKLGDKLKLQPEDAVASEGEIGVEGEIDGTDSVSLEAEDAERDTATEAVEDSIEEPVEVVEEESTSSFPTSADVVAEEQNEAVE
jgi:hypothetical protein